MTDAPRDVPENDMDRLADRLAKALSGHGRQWTRDQISLRMIAEFAWVFGLEVDFKLARLAHSETKGGGNGA